MDDKVEISLCMGSSCFARGNNRLLAALEKAVETNGWQDRVILSGTRCENRCGGGPNVVVNGTLHQGMDEGTLIDLLRDKLGLRTDSSSATVAENHN
jgi:NADH:ubiquinone oxidoreductase subunit E